HRFFVVHRLLWRPGAATTLGFWEGGIAAGHARTLEPWFANILNVGLLVEYDRNITVNSLLGVDFESRLGGVKLFAQALLDDIQVDRQAASDSEPPSYGVTLGAETVVQGVVITGFYTQVANLTYRTPNPAEAVESRLVGLGRNFSDYDQLTLRASLLAGPGVLVQPEATLLRQGEGDFRLPYPPVAAYGTTPTLFAGDVERISPEAPVPVVTVHTRRSALGGAANVAANVSAIGAECRLVAVIGDDARGDSLRAELAQNRLADRHIVVAAARPTTSKTRVTARGQQVVRIDEEVEDLIAPRAENQLLGQLDAAMADADAVLIEDYNKGTLTPGVIERAMTLAKKRGIPVIV